MSTSRSLHRKIQTLLALIDTSESATLTDLKKDIESQGIQTFIRQRFNPETERFVTEVSESSLKRALHIARRLHLIDSENALTEYGIAATIEADYDAIIAKRVIAVLREEGVEIETLTVIVDESLARRPPVMPTSSELWTQSASTLNKGLFGTLLTLLGDAGGATKSRKHIYIAFRGS